MKKICKVEGCASSADRKDRGSRGWCVTHYTRWRRHGDPVVIKVRPEGLAMAFFESVVIPYSGDDCLIWPYGKTPKGYAIMAFPNGGSSRVHRRVCERVNGPPPSKIHMAAHTCGKGHLACVSPQHVYWATPQQNQDDRRVHGTSLAGAKHPMAKLTEDEVRQIRMHRGKSHRKTAAKFGVSKVTVTSILSGKTWGSVT